MKLSFSLILLFLSFYSFSQFNTVSFFPELKNYNNTIAPDSLSRLLTTPYKTELEKVKSIFYWITDNIAYNTVRYQNRKIDFYNDEADYDADTIYKTLDERVALLTLKRGYSLCDGYARLFKTLCNFAGIKSEVITGYARTNFGSSQFKCNHKWNAVMIDSNWYLLDATWASGYISYNNDFVRAYDGSYFLASPKSFIQNHYPDDIKWTLLDNPPTLPEFNHSPFRLPSFNFKIVSYTPSKGIINATVGDTIKITLQTIDDNKRLFLSDKSSLDSADFACADSCIRTDKNYVVKDDKITASYIVSTEDAQWLQVMYNGEVVLRYKLNIKREPYPLIHIKDISEN